MPPPGTLRPLATTEPIVAARPSHPSCPNALRCFSCGEMGHRQMICPNSGRRGLLAEGIEIGYLENFNAAYDEYIEGKKIIEEITEEQFLGDLGPLLVL